MTKKIIGLVGEIGAGKSTIAAHLVSKGCHHLRFSFPIEEEIRRRGLPLERAIYQDVGDEWRSKFGLDYISKLLLKKVDETDKQLFVVEGFRNPGELPPFRQREDFFLLGLVADPKVRFQRLRDRGLPPDPKSWKAFLVQENRDQGKGQPEFGQNNAAVIKLADVQLSTDRDISEVLEAVDTVLRTKGVI